MTNLFPIQFYLDRVWPKTLASPPFIADKIEHKRIIQQFLNNYEEYSKSIKNPVKEVERTEE